MTEAGHTQLRGFTLIEVMIAMVLVVIAALGTLSYQYLCINQVRVSQAELTATRIGQLLLEDWKSTGGISDYNPEYLQLGFEMPSAEESGHCIITVDDLTFYIRLYHDDIAVDDVAGVTLRQITAIVRWRKNFGRGTVKVDDPAVVVTTYVRRDQG